MRALGHSFVGAPGLEFWGPWTDRDVVRDAIIEAGSEFGLRLVGGRAYGTYAVEAGWIPSPLQAIYSTDEMRAYREWLPGDSFEAVASIGRSYVSRNIEDYYLSPWDLDYGRLVNFNHDFIGRESLQKSKNQPDRKKVTLAWCADDVLSVQSSILSGIDNGKFMELPSAHYAAHAYDQVPSGGRLVGLSTYPAYLAVDHQWISLATIDESEATLGRKVSVRFSDGTSGAFDLVVGADGYRSRTRQQVFPDAPGPQFTGQSGWRYNFPRPPEVTCLRAFEGPLGFGLTPLSESLMYMFVTTPEPGNPRYDPRELASSMRSKLTVVPKDIAALRDQIVEDSEVVYRPLEWLFLEGPWHKGRVVLIGDAAHATTPHLGQGAGMAIEDSIVLADELARGTAIEAVLPAFQARRHDRCRYIVESSLAICRGQLGFGPRVEQASATKAMFERVAQPI